MPVQNEIANARRRDVAESKFRASVTHNTRSRERASPDPSVSLFVIRLTSGTEKRRAILAAERAGTMLVTGRPSTRTVFGPLLVRDA